MSLKGKVQLQRRLKAIGDTQILLREIQLETIAEAKRLVPRKTGHLGRSILPGRVSDDSAIIEARTPYAAAVEFGTKRHVIVPKRASVLAWPASEGGRRLSGRARTRAGKPTGPTIFAARVNHPGTKAQPYLIPAAEKALERHGFRDLIVKRWNDAA
jgi:hypothetical protein